MLKLERDIANGAYRKCPACGELSKSEALKCKHCATDVTSIVVPERCMAEKLTGMKLK